MAKTRARNQERESHWREVITRQQRSGLSVRAFCGREGIHESGFHYWKVLSEGIGAAAGHDRCGSRHAGSRRSRARQWRDIASLGRVRREDAAHGA